jgi:hypothetical protein
MKPERRTTRREKPEKLSYIQFEPEGGGIVVNASERGLAFHVATALRLRGPIRLSVSPNPLQQIKLAGECAWMDETKKSGGLRFTELTADASNQIRQWLGQAAGPEPADGKSGLPRVAPSEESDTYVRAPNSTSALLSPAPGNARPLRADVAAHFCSLPAETAPSAPFFREEQFSVSRPRRLRVLAPGFLVFVLALMPIFLSQDFRREIGAALVRIGEKLGGNAVRQPHVSPSTPLQIPDPGFGSTPPGSSPGPETPRKETLEQSRPGASTETTEAPVNSTDSRPGDRQTSRQFIAEANSTSDRSAFARQLWSALGAGDSSAEVRLAQLYLTGDGVPKNCEQARVLLRAASRNGNREATEQLRKLGKSACR